MRRPGLETIRTELGGLRIELPKDAYVFSNDPTGARPWNPDWATHKASDLAAAAGVKLNIKGLRHYTASQLLAARFDLRNTAARLGHGSGGATTLRHYADPVSEVDRRATLAAEWHHIYGGERPDLARALEFYDRWLPGTMRRIAAITRSCVPECAMRRRQW